MRKKILYLMHVDWDWIKQRPHYMAEHLFKYYELLVVCPYNISRVQLTKNDRTGMKVRPIPHIPFQKNFRAIFVLDNFLMKIYIRYLLRTFNPEYVWITFPDLYKSLPSNHNCKIIYDCMDNAGEFSTHKDINADRVKIEIDLIKHASIIFASSENLMRVLNDREYCKHKMMLIRNAFDGIQLPIASSGEHSINKNIYKICYVGTVSSWFDFDSLRFCLQYLDNIEFHIIGPVDNCIDKKIHERIIFHGSVNHDNLYLYIKDFDCMIMPFVLNNLILSVDPVKLYEYVNFNKPIITIFYDELKRFSKYVSFYSTKKELLDLITGMIKVGFINKYTEHERAKLLEENSWDVRMHTIMQCLEKTSV